MPDPKDPRPEDLLDPERRSDAAGFDVAAPPGTDHPAHGNPGLSDDPRPAREGWSEFDADVEWSGDAPYPAGAAEDDAADEGDDTEGSEPAAPSDGMGADIAARVTERLDDDPTLAIDDLSVERRGDVVVLRGTAATAEDRARAAVLALGVGGVARVDNQLEADAAGED